MSGTPRYSKEWFFPSSLREILAILDDSFSVLIDRSRLQLPHACISKLQAVPDYFQLYLKFIFASFVEKYYLSFALWRIFQDFVHAMTKSIICQCVKICWFLVVRCKGHHTSIYCPLFKLKQFLLPILCWHTLKFIYRAHKRSCTTYRYSCLLLKIYQTCLLFVPSYILCVSSWIEKKHIFSII